MSEGAIPLLRATHLRPLLVGMRHIGAPSERYLRQARLPLLAHDDPQAVVPELFVWDLARRVARSEGVADYGGLAATLTPVWQSEPALVSVLQTTPTLWLALRTFCRLADRVTTAAPFHVHRQRDHALFWREKRPGTPGEDQAELYSLHVMIQLVQVAAGRQWIPPEVLVSEVNTRRLRDWQANGGARVRRCETCTGVLVPAGMLALPMSAIAPVSGEMLPERLADDFLESLRAVIGSYLRDRRPDIGLAAEMAGLTERTFQRRLEVAGLSYRSLLDQIRLRHALAMLCDPGVHVTDIAYDLGFSDVAHFTRAFRRWTTLSPREFRRRHAHSARDDSGAKGQDDIPARPYPDALPMTHSS